MRRVRPIADRDERADAARLLRAGGLVAVPTETVYGLAANALDARAVARIFEAKRRPSFDPLIVHLADREALGRVVDEPSCPPEAERLMEAFWPGPLTLVLPRSASVPDLVTSGLPNVAVRVPDHDLVRALIREAGVPLAAPSANPFGAVSPTTAQHVAEGLGAAVDRILDGGATGIGLESTIVGFEAGEAVVYRAGGTTHEALERALGRGVRTGVRVLERPLAPGQLARHYATRTPLRLLDASAAERAAGGADVGLLVVSGTGPVGADERWGAVRRLAPSGDLREAAASLFATMRELDASGLLSIEAILCEEEGLGRAIVDRLRRAATPSLAEG